MKYKIIYLIITSKYLPWEKLLLQRWEFWVNVGFSLEEENEHRVCKNLEINLKQLSLFTLLIFSISFNFQAFLM